MRWCSLLSLSLSLSLCLSLSLSAYFTPPNSPLLPCRSCFTIIGTTTSFLFISSNSLPQLPYKTRLDNFFIFQFCIALFLGAWNIYSTNRVDRFKKVYIKTIVSRAKAAKARAEELAAAAKERAAKAGDSMRAGGVWLGCPAICCSPPAPATATATADPVAESAEVVETKAEKERKEDEAELKRVMTEFDLSQWEFYLSEGSEKTSKSASFLKNRSSKSMRSMLSLSKSRSRESFLGIPEGSFRQPQTTSETAGTSEFDYGIEVVPEIVETAPSAEAEKSSADVDKDKKDEVVEEEENKLKVDFGEIPQLIRGILEFHQLGLKFMDKKGDDEQLSNSLSTTTDSDPTWLSHYSHISPPPLPPLPLPLTLTSSSGGCPVSVRHNFRLHLRVCLHRRSLLHLPRVAKAKSCFAGIICKTLGTINY